MLAQLRAVARVKRSIYISRQTPASLMAIHRAPPRLRSAARFGSASKASAGAGAKFGMPVFGMLAAADRSLSDDSGVSVVAQLVPALYGAADRAIRAALFGPLKIRDFTVPTEISKISETSSYDSPSRSRKITALRNTSGTCDSALRTAN